MPRAMTITEEVEFVTDVCCQCHCIFAIEQRHYNRLRENNQTFYCPSGHPLHYPGKSEAKILQEKLDLKSRELQIKQARLEAEIAANNRITAEKATIEKKLRKTEKRISGGVCPCCNRHFVNVERHMKTKHGGVSRP